MYNDLEYDFQTMMLPNIVMAEHKKKAHATTVIHPFMKPLIMRLAKAYPKWRFIGVSRYMSDDASTPWQCHTFKVYDGNEELGIISKEWSGRHGDLFGMDSRRLSSKRLRGDRTTTKDIDKACKMVANNFGIKTAHELASESRIQIARAINGVFHTANTTKNNYLMRMHQSSLNFAKENWDNFYGFALKDGVSKDVLDNVWEVMDHHNEIRKIQVALGEGDCDGGSLITLRGSDYIVTKGSVTAVMSNEDLTPAMKRAVGLLKLANVGDVINGIGIKGSDNDLFILAQEESNDEGQE